MITIRCKKCGNEREAGKKGLGELFDGEPCKCSDKHFPLLERSARKHHTSKVIEGKKYKVTYSCLPYRDVVSKIKELMPHLKASHNWDKCELCKKYWKKTEKSDDTISSFLVKHYLGDVEVKK